MDNVLEDLNYATTTITGTNKQRFSADMALAMKLTSRCTKVPTVSIAMQMTMLVRLPTTLVLRSTCVNVCLLVKL